MQLQDVQRITPEALGDTLSGNSIVVYNTCLLERHHRPQLFNHTQLLFTRYAGILSYVAIRHGWLDVER